MAYGYRFPTNTEQLRLFERFEDAMAWRAPITLTYFKEHGRDRGGYMLYTRTTRIIEPYELTTTAGGAIIVRVIDRTARDKRPAYRSVRLDRIAVSRCTNRPLLTVHTSRRYLHPSPLDDMWLHPTKGQLNAL